MKGETTKLKAGRDDGKNMTAWNGEEKIRGLCFEIIYLFYKSTNTNTSKLKKDDIPMTKSLMVWIDELSEGLHSPPLAYSMIRYKVFSVSITSNSWTVTHSGRDVNTKATQTLEFTTAGAHERVTHQCWDGWVFSWCEPLGITGKLRKKNVIKYCYLILFRLAIYFLNRGLTNKNTHEVEYF